MPKVTLRPGGINIAVPGPSNPLPPRSAIAGWTEGAARRNRQFLQSIDLEQVTGHGFFYTLTLRDLPPSSADWGRMIKAWLCWLRDHGVARFHWVIEFQRRGVPHLHVVAYWDTADDPLAPFLAVDHWLKLSAPYGSLPIGQSVVHCDQRVELLRYMAKHSARSVEHYQRRRGDMPEGWQTTGRLWGASRSWPTSTEAFEVNERAFWLLRRLTRSYRIAQARKRLARARRSGDPSACVAARRSLTSSRSCLRCPNRAHSRVRPLALWIPEGVSWAFLGLLLDDPASDVERSSTPARPSETADIGEGRAGVLLPA